MSDTFITLSDGKTHVFTLDEVPVLYIDSDDVGEEIGIPFENVPELLQVIKKLTT
jgi:hypothetical protein